jgi:hypothetical protein
VPLTRKEIEERMAEPARKYFELGPQICNPRRKENRRRALRIGPRAKEAGKGVIGLETQPLRRGQDGGLGDHARAHVLNYPFLITYLGLLVFWVVVICLILV